MFIVKVYMGLLGQVSIKELGLHGDVKINRSWVGVG